MASQNDVGWKTYQASAAISAFLAVQISGDGYIYTSAFGSPGVGVTQMDIAAGSYGDVKLWTAPGTFDIQATASAITVGTTYSIVTGGYVGVVATGAAAIVQAQENGVASNGIILEYLYI